MRKPPGRPSPWSVLHRFVELRHANAVGDLESVPLPTVEPPTRGERRRRQRQLARRLARMQARRAARAAAREAARTTARQTAEESG